MHLLLTDRLTCPRCGPGFGLILLSTRLVERRVLAGSLGCPNCRERYPIEEGFADLRPPPRDPLPPVERRPAPDGAATDRLAALLGITSGPGNVALLGAASAHAGALAERLADIELIAIDDAARAEPELDRVSRLVAGPELPFHPWTFRALASVGDAIEPEEALRVVAKGGRIVIENATADARTRLEAGKADILAADGGWIVAHRKTS